MLGTRLGLKREYAGLQKFAVYAHYVGARAAERDRRDAYQNGPRAGPLVLDHSSFPEKISVGVVMDTHRYRSLRPSSGRVLDMFLTEQPIMRERLRGATAGEQSLRQWRLFLPKFAPFMATDGSWPVTPLALSTRFSAVASFWRFSAVKKPPRH